MIKKSIFTHPLDHIIHNLGHTERTIKIKGQETVIIIPIDKSIPLNKGYGSEFQTIYPEISRTIEGERVLCFEYLTWDRHTEKATSHYLPMVGVKKEHLL